MTQTTTTERPIISQEELLEHWNGHRKLTRRTIEVFPEKDLFTFSIVGMRTFSELCKEIIAVSAGGMKQIATDIIASFDDGMPEVKDKSDLLKAWDNATEQINVYWKQLTPDVFHKEINLFGEYKFSAISNIQYFIDNEVHHRAQGYVYLRSLGIEPPFFWDRY